LRLNIRIGLIVAKGRRAFAHRLGSEPTTGYADYADKPRKGFIMPFMQHQLTLIPSSRTPVLRLGFWTMITSLTATTLIPMAAYAHIGIAQKAVNDMFDGRDYEEGTSQFIDILLPHDCSNDAGEHFPTEHVSVMIPNGASIDPSVSMTVNEQGTPHGANVMMGSKASVNANWQEVRILKGMIAPGCNR
jgi:hypothetical protein